jgi:hypothetical protein
MRGKEPKLCTYSFVFRKGDEEVPFESLSEEEQKKISREITYDFSDGIMGAKGYRRVGAQHVGR